MATAPQAIERFTEDNLFVASPALTALRLRSVRRDLWPISSKGGGSKSPQVELHHLANFILAQAAHLPIDAVSAVDALRDTTTIEGSNTLGDALEARIAETEKTESHHNWIEVVLCVDHNFARIIHRSGSKVATTIFGSSAPFTRAQRLVNIPFKVISVCSELWKDTQTRILTSQDVHLQNSHERSPPLRM